MTVFNYIAVEETKSMFQTRRLHLHRKRLTATMATAIGAKYTRAKNIPHYEYAPVSTVWHVPAYSYVYELYEAREIISGPLCVWAPRNPGWVGRVWWRFASSQSRGPSTQDHLFPSRPL